MQSELSLECYKYILILYNLCVYPFACLYKLLHCYVEYSCI